MTVMDPRPWSPASPHIGPDEEDLALLLPTGDVEADLGSVVLAVHRVGAAAAEAVARAPLPDEFRLVDALAEARSALAPSAVEAVSKCVTSTNPAGYADLLLRDLFDAGENGAITVYRSCVAKGVAPPLAVQRAGLVYGVSREDLGPYLGVATDPKSHPIAIADAADRVVARWASGVVRDELAEPVAKAATETVQEFNATAFGREHPKDSRGRFTDLLDRTATAPASDRVAGQQVGFLARLRRDTGVGSQAAPEVEGAPVAVAAPPAPTPVRAQRRQRIQRRQREQAPTVESAVRSRVKFSVRSRLRGDFGAKLRARLNTQRADTDNVEPLQDYHDVERSISREFRQRLNKPLAWSMSLGQADEIFNAAAGAGTPDKPKHVRMGQLQQTLAEPLEWTDQHHRQMRDLAEEVAGDQRPAFVHISADELESAGVPIWGNNREAIEAAVKDYVRMAGYYNQLAHDPDGTYNPALAASMGLAPSADVGTGDWYLVLNPEPVVYGDPEGAPVPAAAEFVLIDESSNTARVNIEGGSHPSYELDPTQEWVIHEPETLWKQTGDGSGYWVDRYTVEPLESYWEGGKAATITQERWRTEPRNAGGEWTKGGFLARVAPTTTERKVVTPVVTPIAPRAQRRQRVQRSQRAPQETPVATPVNATLSSKLRSRLPVKLLRAFHEGLADDYEVIDTSTPAWDDRARYLVYSADEWDHLLRQNGYKGYRNEVVPSLPLSSAAKARLVERMDEAVDGVSADTEVRLHVENEITYRHRNARKEIKALRTVIPDDEHAGEAWRELGKRIRNMMAVDHTIQSVQVESSLSDPNKLMVMANAHPVSDVIVVVLPDDIDPDRPIALQFSGRARQSALNRNVDRYYDEALHIDAPVQMFRATQGTKQVYHARQDER